MDIKFFMFYECISRLSKANASIFLHSQLENLEDNEIIAIFATK